MLSAGVRCVVFDFDGTLVDSNTIKTESFYDVVGGISGSAAIMDRLLGAADRGDRYDTFKRFVDAAVVPASRAHEFVERYGRRCEKLIATCPEIPGASEALAELRAGGIKIFVNSSTPKEPLSRIIRLRGLDDSVDGVFGGPSSKTANLSAILRRTSCRPREVVVVGDGEDDRAAAAALGCAFIGIGRHGRPAGATILADLAGLVAMLDLGGLAARAN